jgi:DNA adenine methylase
MALFDNLSESLESKIRNNKNSSNKEVLVHKENMDPYLSPLRYPGSKRRISGFILETLKKNNYRPQLYVEPFLGGASVALQLLVDDMVDEVILIDIDPIIAYFWEVVFFDTDWLIEQINLIDVSLDTWKKLKLKEPNTKREFALACIFFNRTNFSGILRPEVGPLGGKNQNSQYNISCRFPKNKLIKRIERISQYRNRVYGIWGCSWLDGIKKIRELQESKKLPTAGGFYYFDPPFFEKADSLYRHYFLMSDHIELRNFLLSLNDYWMLSYDASQNFDLLYGETIENNTNGAKKKDVELVYSTGVTLGRKPTKEVIVSNFGALPDEAKFWKTASGK